MMDHLALVHSLDELYRGAVISPGEWTDARLASWADDLFAAPPGREVARHVRRAMRVSRKLAAFWHDPDARVPSDAGDWRTRVDLAVGASGWRPVLDVARLGLEEAPSRELFEEVGRLFRVVHHEVWMEGVSYEEWLAADDA